MITTRRVAISRETRAAIIGAVKLGLESLRADPPQSLSQWAAEHFRLAGESSHQKGAWQAWPMQVGIMDMMSDDRIEELDVQKAKRLGYTKMITAFIAYNIAHRRRKQAIWQPTDDDRDSYVKSEIDPVLDPVTGVESVRRARRAGSKSEDTMKLKVFRDSALHILGGKAARAYRRITVAVAILDEWSGFDLQIEKSGDAGGLAKGRLEGAPYPKFIGGSTPRIKGLCQTERARLAADVDLRYYIECPHCGAEHPLEWGGKTKLYGFKWDEGNPASVRHVCPHCHGTTTQADYMPGGKPRAGAWVCIKTGLRLGVDRIWRDNTGMPTRPPKHVGLQVWSAYSPQRSWESIVREFIAALESLKKGDVGPMQLFVNETLGETWELQGDRTDEHELQARAEPYALGVVQDGGLILTAGIDVQRNRWEIGVWAWGRGLESWCIEHKIIEGNAASDEDWEQLTTWLQRRYVQAWHGGTMGISSISIDSSDQTQAVYNWARKMTGILPVRAIKGAKEANKPIKNPATAQEVNWRGKRWPKGLKLWPVGVNTAKDLLLGQLAIDKPGPGYVHTSDQLEREWYEQLTAEQRIIMRTPSGETHRWVKRRPRNEVLDCRVYATHAAYCLGLHQYTDAKWSQLEQAVQPDGDLFAMAANAGPNMPARIETTGSATGQPAAPTKKPPATRAADDGWSFDRRT